MRWIFPFFLCLAHFTQAQVTDSFADGNFTESPQWVGQTDKFMVNADFQLQLKAPTVASEAWLFTASQASENAEWSFDVGMQFDPSSQNYARVYLMSDSSDPLLARNGFFVMLGGTEDEVSLYQLKNGTAAKIIDGSNGRLSASSVNVSIKASYNRGDGWLLQTHINSAWQTEGSSPVRPGQTAQWFGVYCRYSSTRSDKFVFDNFVVSGTAIQDVDAPTVTQVEALSGNAVAVTFSEGMEGRSAIAQSFLLNPLNAHPASIEVVAANQLTLRFSDRLVDGAIGHLRIEGLTDLSGNGLADTSVVFAYHQFKCTVAKAISNSCVRFAFNKTLAEEGVRPEIFRLSPGNVVATSVEQIDDKTIEICFDTAFQNKSEYNLNLNGLTDLNQDALLNPSLSFHYFKPERHDLVFSELMTDPDPANGLPNAEYVELYNRSSLAIDLSGFYLLMAGKTYMIESGSIGPNGYACLVAQKDDVLWTSYPNVVPMKSFPALLNTSGNLVLSSPTGTVMDAVAYNDSWLGGTFKDDGGWSFERMDMDNFSHIDNWGRALHLTGGTPGVANSISEGRPDLSSPYLSFLELLDNKWLKLHFSEPIANLTSVQVALNNESAQVLSVAPDSVWCKTLVLELDALTIGSGHSVKFSPPITDFAGNNLVDFFPPWFAATETLKPNDIIINEILFNPRGGEDDFIELFNASDKTFKLSDLYVTVMEGDMPKSLVRLSEFDIPVMPGSFFSFGPNPLPYLGKAVSPWWFLKNKSMPNFPDNGGDVAITTANGMVVDRVNYREEWHFPLLNSTEGVSLERIRFNQSSNNKNNWQSAAYQTGYCTPTGANSQASNLADSGSDGTFELLPEVFTPDGDGSDDVLLIEAGKGMEGHVATLKVFDAIGREVCLLANNELLGIQSQWKWDGTTNKGELLPNGIYVVWFRSFDDSGNTFEEKKVCVLGSKPH